LASWIQGFFTWLHVFNTQKIFPFHCQIIIIIIVTSLSLPHHHHHYHFDINANNSQQSPPLSLMKTPSTFCSDACLLYPSLCFSPPLTSMEKGSFFLII